MRGSSSGVRCRLASSATRRTSSTVTVVEFSVVIYGLSAPFVALAGGYQSSDAPEEAEGDT